MTLLPDVYAYLQANGQSEGLRWGRLGDSPDDAVLVTQYPGLRPLAVHNRSGISQERPGCQIQVRNPQWEAAYLRAYTVYNLICGLTNVTLTSGTFYQGFQPVGSIFQLDTDLRDRIVLAMNFYVTKDRG